MPRVRTGVSAHKRHKKILKLAKGYKGAKSKQFKKANETVMKALYYARRDRRAKKGGLPVSTLQLVLMAFPTAA